MWELCDPPEPWAGRRWLGPEQLYDRQSEVTELAELGTRFYLSCPATAVRYGAFRAIADSITKLSQRK